MWDRVDGLTFQRPQDDDVGLATKGIRAQDTWTQRSASVPVGIRIDGHHDEKRSREATIAGSSLL